MLNRQKSLIFASVNKLKYKMEAFKEVFFGGAPKGVKSKKIAPKIYTTNLIDSSENIIRRNLFEILAWRLPGCVISHKSAQLLRPTEQGYIYITYSFTKKITDYPGIVLNIMQGPTHIASDIRLGSSDVYCSSEYRWILEVLQPARKNKDGESKGLPISAIEERLDSMIRIGGEERLNLFRDRAREIATELNLTQEFEKLNKLISALLATHSSNILTTTQGKARAAGEPMDPARIPIFEALYEELSNRYFPVYEDNNKSEEAFRMFSFFESYFSNYIEGTEFEISEAKQIVDTGITIPKRIADSHDILGTFKLLSNRQEMSLIPKTEDEFIKLLQHRHSVLLEGRPECSPGFFKDVRNRAGNTEFVAPELVIGTLKYAFKLYCNLKEPFAKAAYMMFICSEIHPFIDGNGRVSRIMMNAELFSQGQIRIIIPTVFREDYILSLRSLSRHKNPQPFINVLQKMQNFSANLWGEDFYALDAYLRECNAYSKPDEAKLLYINRLGTKR